jgi:hypothetical protein
MGLRILTIMIFLTVAIPVARAEPVSTEPCSLSREDKVENAKLTFDDFDQKGVISSTWRQLSNRKCEIQAIEAAEDYLIHGQVTREGERHNIIFHIGQSLAMANKYEEAALMMASSKNPTQQVNSEQDWNTYVDGTWAFLKRDRVSLENFREQLLKTTGYGNNINTAVLTGLLNCFDQPYSIAYDQLCRDGKNPTQ